MPLKNLVGHRRISGLLARAIAGQSLPPSLLFTGPDGVGKRTLATAVGEVLNCLSPTKSASLAVDACGVCTVCRRIARNMYPDVFTVAPGDSGSIPVDAIRDVVERTAYRPFEGRKRVVIVDDAETMLPAAQNALLKTLEEPPSGSIFVLVTSMPDLLLPTVRSRCAHLRFGRLTVARGGRRADHGVPCEIGGGAPCGATWGRQRRPSAAGSCQGWSRQSGHGSRTSQGVGARA